MDTQSNIQDRITELRRVPASELRANPKNWRRHPRAQHDALAGILQEVGFADAVIARETPNGLELLDGHLRQEVMGNQPIPVLVVDVTEAEADKLLATFDPLAAMAQTDQAQLQELLHTAQFASQAVSDMLAAVTSAEPPLVTDSPAPILYSQAVDAPIYQPTGPQPDINDLTDRSTADGLIDEIQRAELPLDIEKFLLDAAERHVEFNFERIANYYAHSSPNIQALMERSALVIIDYDQAIANGFVRLKEDIDAAFQGDYPDA